MIIQTSSARKRQTRSDCDDAYDTGGYSQTSKHVRCRSTKSKVENSGSRDRTPGEMEGSCDKLKIEGLVKSRTLTGKVG